LCGAAAGVDAQGEVDQAGDDGRVADGGEVEARCVAGGDDPDHGLAAVQAVGFGPVVFGEVGELAAQVDQVLVALGPVAEEGEFVADGGLGGLGGGFEGEGGVGHFKGGGGRAWIRISPLLSQKPWGRLWIGPCAEGSESIHLRGWARRGSPWPVTPGTPAPTAPPSGLASRRAPARDAARRRRDASPTWRVRAH